MQLQVHLSVELCLHSSGHGGGHLEQPGKQCRKASPTLSKCSTQMVPWLGLVPGAWMGQERVMMGPALWLWPAPLFEHSYSQTIREFQLATKAWPWHLTQVAKSLTCQTLHGQKWRGQAELYAPEGSVMGS